MTPSLFSHSDTKSDIEGRVEVGKWCLVQQPETHNIMGLNTPFWGRYQARKVSGVEDGRVSKTAIIMFDASSQEGKLLRDYEPAHMVLAVNLTEDGARKMASALSTLDIQFKSVVQSVLMTKGETPHPLFQAGPQDKDSYTLIEPTAE